MMTSCKSRREDKDVNNCYKSESEKANSILKIENMELKEKLDLVTSELKDIQLKQGNSI